MTTTRQFLQRLHTGGAWSYLWTLEGRRSSWYPVGRELPSTNGARSVYFGVHPCAAIPTTNAAGEPARPETVRSRNELITSVGCLFSEFDAKDFDGDKGEVLAHVDALMPAPSVVIDSGGGYHAYWLLHEPWTLAGDGDRERARTLQAAWVTYTGGDQGAKDLARVLRLPGTHNHKYSPPRPVDFVRCNLGLTYPLADLESIAARAVPEIPTSTRPTPSHSTPSGRNLAPYVQKALDQEVLTVTRAPDHTRNDTLNRAAFALGQLVGATWANLDRATVEAELERAACACGLDQDRGCGMQGIKATIRSGLEAGIAEPRPEPGDNRTTAPSTPTPHDPQPAGSEHGPPTNGALLPGDQGTPTAGEVEQEPEPKIPSRLGQRLSGAVADYVRGIAPDVPDNRLRDAITAALLETRAILGSDGQPIRDSNGNEKRRAVPVLLKRRKAGQLLLDWLTGRGGFVQDTSGRAYYFYEPGRRLFALDSTLWAGFLYAASGVNPASTDYAHLKADCETAAMGAPKREIVKLAAWDAEHEVLRVSRFDGTVYVLDGATIAEESNGEHALFDDLESWQPYDPDLTGDGAALHWSTAGLPNYQAPRKAQAAHSRELWGLAYRAWALSLFFSELCPTRPLCVFLGEKGSGKSMALRVLLRFLFGEHEQISGVPDKPDSFTAAAAAKHILVLDNLDTFSRWLRDKLARIATGADDTLRELYTTNETRRISYRCWVGITTREPDTLQRDDLADRLLVLPVDRLDDDKRQSETSFYREVELMRGVWWGDVLQALNQAVASIRAGKLGAHKSRLRLADWEFLGRVFAENEGLGGLWSNGDPSKPTVVSATLKGQSDLLLEGDPVVEGLRLWLGKPGNAGRRLPVRVLHSELQALLYGDQKPPREWARTTRALGRHIKTVKHDLGTLFDLEETIPTSGEYHKITCYQFWPKGEKPEQGELDL